MSPAVNVYSVKRRSGFRSVCPTVRKLRPDRHPSPPSITAPSSSYQNTHRTLVLPLFPSLTPSLRSHSFTVYFSWKKRPSSLAIILTSVTLRTPTLVTCQPATRVGTSNRTSTYWLVQEGSSFTGRRQPAGETCCYCVWLWSEPIWRHRGCWDGGTREVLQQSRDRGERNSASSYDRSVACLFDRLCWLRGVLVAVGLAF